MKRLNALMIAMVAIFSLSLQSCKDDPTVELVSTMYEPEFKVVNMSAEGKDPLSAFTRIRGIHPYEVTVNVNGESKIIKGTHVFNELPVLAGNKLEISAVFDGSSFSSNICLSLPDGTKQVVSKTDTVFTWIVPADFAPGNRITAQWVDKNGIVETNLTSSITLISL